MRTSPLDAEHRALGARMVPFGGWDMPLEYEGTLSEHTTCRTDAVMFDVSHLGTVRLDNDDSFDRIQSSFTNDLERIGPGRAQYTHLLADDGSVLDDIIVWWKPDGATFDVMPNASNTERVIGAIGGLDVTAGRAVIAVQGPNTSAYLDQVIPEASSIGRFHLAELTWDGTPCTVSATGYTGERGVEISVPAEAAPAMWQRFLDAGLTPAGLGARDTLRLEAGLPLHGHELGPGITPLQAGLAWVVAFDKPSFPGRDALIAERDAGVKRILRGIAAAGRRPPRDGYDVIVEGDAVSTVTSGNFSPTLGHGIAMTFLPPTVAFGTQVGIAARGSTIDGSVVPLPFVAHSR